MIKHIEKNKGTKEILEPYYVLTFKYTIGDADGETEKTVVLSKDNPFIERFCKLLNNLSPIKGYWGVMLEDWRISEHFEEGQITEDDYNFLMRTMFITDYDSYDSFKTESDTLFIDEFYGGVSSKTEYSFLVFEGVSLGYVDEHRIEFDTIFVD